MTHLEFTCSDEKATAILRAARMYDEQADGTDRTSYSQVSKALCGKENATFDELFEAANQLKSRLAQAERERNAAVCDLKELSHEASLCNYCGRFDEGYTPMPPHCKYALDDDCWQWRGVCSDNTKEDHNG